MMDAANDRVMPQDVYDAQHGKNRSGRWFPNLTGTVARMFGRGEALVVDDRIATNLRVEHMALDLAEQLKWNGTKINADVLLEAARLLGLDRDIFRDLPQRDGGKIAG